MKTIDEQSKQLLKEALIILNAVPNHKYGENYTLCSKIEKLLSGLSNETEQRK